jgi:Restriction endonuclease
MSADPIIYCLEHLTDYRQFERLCTDLFSQTGYPDIEPLGGSSDGGRDALHVSRSFPAEITIFAYSVRSDWLTKLLKEDCKRIKEERHKLNHLVFACTSGITAGQRDDAIAAVKESFGWQLTLFSIERIRTRLAGDLRHLVAKHPSIFTPPFFPTVADLSIVGSLDTQVNDRFASADALNIELERALRETEDARTRGTVYFSGCCYVDPAIFWKKLHLWPTNAGT